MKRFYSFLIRDNAFVSRLIGANISNLSLVLAYLSVLLAMEGCILLGGGRIFAGVLSLVSEVLTSLPIVIDFEGSTDEKD